MLLLKQIRTFFTQRELNKIPANRKYRYPINIQNRLCKKRKKVTEKTDSKNKIISETTYKTSISFL